MHMITSIWGGDANTSRKTTSFLSPLRKPRQDAWHSHTNDWTKEAYWLLCFLPGDTTICYMHDSQIPMLSTSKHVLTCTARCHWSNTWNPLYKKKSQGKPYKGTEKHSEWGKQSRGRSHRLTHTCWGLMPGSLHGLLPPAHWAGSACKKYTCGSHSTCNGCSCQYITEKQKKTQLCRGRNSRDGNQRQTLSEFCLGCCNGWTQVTGFEGEMEWKSWEQEWLSFVRSLFQLRQEYAVSCMCLTWSNVQGDISSKAWAWAIPAK